MIILHGKWITWADSDYIDDIEVSVPIHYSGPFPHSVFVFFRKFSNPHIACYDACALTEILSLSHTKPSCAQFYRAA